MSYLYLSYHAALSGRVISTSCKINFERKKTRCYKLEEIRHFVSTLLSESKICFQVCQIVCPDLCPFMLHANTCFQTQIDVVTYLDSVLLGPQHYSHIHSEEPPKHNLGHSHSSAGTPMGDCGAR